MSLVSEEGILRRRQRWLHLTLASALLCGCSSSGPFATSTGAPEPRTDSLATIPKPEQVLPHLSSDEENEVYAAWQRSIASCMTSKGFTYVPIERDATEDLRISRLDQQNAETWGYHQPPPAPPPVMTQDPAASAALNGDGGAHAGCTVWAYSYVYSPGENGYVAQIQSYDLEISQLSAAWSSSQQGAQALAIWSTCMSARGYDFDTPESASRWAYGKYGDYITVLSDDERATRLADLDCDRKANLTQGADDYRADIEATWAADHAAQLLELEQARRAFVEDVRIKLAQAESPDFRFDGA